MADKEEQKERKRVVVEEVEVKNKEADEEKELIQEKEEPIEKESETIVESSIPAVKEIKRETVEVEPKKSPSIALWIIIPGIFLLGAILGGIVFYQKGINSGEKPAETPVASATAAASPTSSPLSTEDLTKYTISILNGSGIAGEAASVKTLLTDEGFKVGTTGNASTYDYTKTIIKAKESVEPAFISALTEALSKTYVVGDEQTLPDTSTDSVQVIVGSSKAE
jgi:hypothetical protein